MNLKNDFKPIESKLHGQTFASIIPTIVSGLYNDTFDIVREYCQNGYDAILKKYGTEASTKGLLNIVIEGRNLRISDNGTGMTVNILKKAATIGYSSKDEEQQVGYRGIGRLSGIAAAHKIHFVTKTVDSPSELLFVIEARKLMDTLTKEVKFTKEAGPLLAEYSGLFEKRVPDKDRQKSYTTVILYNVYGEAGKILDEERLRYYLEMNLPVPVDPQFRYATDIESLYKEHVKYFPAIKINLNSNRLYKPFQQAGTGLKYSSMELKNKRGRKLALAWYLWERNGSNMLENKRLRGLRYKHKGFTIGSTDSMRDILGTSPVQIPDWFAGEIIVCDDRAKVSSDRSRFEDTEARTDIECALKATLKEELERIARSKSKKKSVENKISRAKDNLEELRKTMLSQKHISSAELHNQLDVAKESKIEIENLKRNRSLDEGSLKEIDRLCKAIDKCAVKTKKRVKESPDVGRLLAKSKPAKIVYDIAVNVIMRYWGKSESPEEMLSQLEHRIVKELE